jgi:hypothetical protein
MNLGYFTINGMVGLYVGCKPSTSWSNCAVLVGTSKHLRNAAVGGMKVVRISF